MKKIWPIIAAIATAFLYALGAPFGKLITPEIPPFLLIGFLFLGVAGGIGVMFATNKIAKKPIGGDKIEKKHIPYLIGSGLSNFAATLCVMLATTVTAASTIGLVSTWQVVATALIALIFFKEKIGKFLWIGLGLICVAVVVLSIDPSNGFSIDAWCLLPLGAYTFYSIDSNLQNKISGLSPYVITINKAIWAIPLGFIGGLVLGDSIGDPIYIVYALVLGFFSYGLSVFISVYAQRGLGAAKTGAWISLSPFFAVLLSLIFLKEIPQYTFYIGLGIMAVATVFVVLDKNKNDKKIEKETKVG